MSGSLVALGQMRRFHNQIKRKILKKYASKEYFQNRVKLLDLACGKGGDLNKWLTNYWISSVKGYDIDQASITEAKRRLENVKGKHKPISFVRKDLSESILSGRLKYDIITIHFAFHYFFRDETSFRRITKTILNSLKPGGILIITILDAPKVKPIDNTKIKLDMFPMNSKDFFGNRIDVWIKDSVLDKATPEYLVEPFYLVKTFEDKGLTLIEHTSFDQFPGFNKLTPIESEYSRMNSVFVFQKKAVGGIAIGGTVVHSKKTKSKSIK